MGQQRAATALVVVGTAVLSACGSAEPVAAPAPSSSAASGTVVEPAPVTELEPYVVNTAPGTHAGPAVWLDGAVALTDLAADPYGDHATVHDADLEPVDLGPVAGPQLSHAITGGALVQGGDASNRGGWHAVQGGRITFSIPFSIYSTPPVVGYRYAVVPEGEDRCGGTVWDLRAGSPNGVVLPPEQCLVVVSDHYGLLQEDSHDMPEFAVDLLTGEVVDTPRTYSTERSLAYDHDGVRWTVPVEPDDVAVGYGRVLYRTGDDVVVLDSEDGAELDRWSAAEVLQRSDCLLSGVLAEDRVLFTCGEDPYGAGAESVVVGYRPVAQS